VLVAAAIIPSAPVLVPELSRGAAEVADLREAVLTAASGLPDRWVAVGVGTENRVWGPEAAGTFAGYGVDVPVSLGPDAGPVAPLPLCALITGWVRGQVRPAAHARVHTVTDPRSAAELGRDLRTELDAPADPVGVLVVADGCHTLTPGAPGGHDPSSVAVQSALDEALAAGDGPALAALPEAVVGRAAYAVLSGLLPTPAAVDELYRGFPFGVGYTVCVWRP
jgi:hypothetical protein